MEDLPRCVILSFIVNEFQESCNVKTMIVESSPEYYRPADHEEFFVGWPVKPTYEVVIKHFEATQALFLINDDSEVVGVISVLTDHVLYAFIALLEVRQSEQGKGLGKFLVAEMLKSLEGTYAIDLVCDAEMESFYQPFGFTKWTAMIQRNRDALQ